MRTDLTGIIFSRPSDIAHSRLRSTGFDTKSLPFVQTSHSLLHLLWTSSCRKGTLYQENPTLVCSVHKIVRPDEIPKGRNWKRDQ